MAVMVARKAAKARAVKEESGDEGPPLKKQKGPVKAALACMLRVFVFYGFNTFDRTRRDRVVSPVMLPRDTHSALSRPIRFFDLPG